MNTDIDPPPHARIPADVATPDKIIYGLTARQALIVAVAAVAAYLLWRTVGPLLPPPLAVAMLIPLLGAAVVLAVGRRDGLSLDRWLLAAVQHTRAPKRHLPTPDATSPAAPAWAPDLPAGASGPAPAVLRLPATAITADGVIDLGDGRAATMVGAATLNIELRTGAEQWALLAGYGRWLNALNGPVQIVISSRPVDLTGHATRIGQRSVTIAHPALVAAAGDYAAFLLEVAAGREPLARTVTVVCTATGLGAAAEATRRGRLAATALAALGGSTRLLDGAEVTAAITAATDPYQYGDAGWRRTTPSQPVTVADGLRP